MKANFNDLKGKILKSIDVNSQNDEITFKTECGKTYLMFHEQYCCEGVSIDDINGDLEDLIGNPILLAEKNSSLENPAGIIKEYQDSFTWTFYKLATIKGYLDIRWYGESNGYYSEEVDFKQI